VTNRIQWADALMGVMGWNANVRDGIVAQEHGESTEAKCNPLASTEPWPGSTDYNSAGVKNYASLQDGLAATKATLENGNFPRMLAAGRQGDPSAYVEAVASEPWGTWSTEAQAQQALAQVRNDPTIGDCPIDCAGPTPQPEEDDVPLTATSPSNDTQRHVYRENPDGTVDHWHQDTEGPNAGVWGKERLP